MNHQKEVFDLKSLPMKLLSIFLVLVLLVNMLPMGVFAQEVREDILASETQPCDKGTVPLSPYW